MASDIQKVLEALPSGPPCMPVEALADRCGLSVDRTTEVVERLRKISLADERTPACYVAMVQNAAAGQGPITAEVARSPLGRAWTIIRAQKKVDFGQLLAMTGLRLWDFATLRPWLEGLEGAGVLAALERAPDEEPAWVLVKAAMGPRIPIVISTKGGRPLHVWDPNSGDSLPIGQPKKRPSRKGGRK